MPAEIHDVLELRLPARREELLVAELWESGTVGIESRSDGGVTVLEAWFEAPAPPALLDPDAALYRRLGAELAGARRLPGDDWMRAYREYARPFPLGRGFLVDPREPGAEPPAPTDGGRRLLRLPARRAFGVGSHESTRLAVGLLETMPLAGADVLDLGTGTGILALVALARGARWALGVEIDPVAALTAGENRRRNDLGPALVAGSLDALAPAPRFAVAAANLIPTLLLPELAGLAARLAPGGRLLLSGLLGVQWDEVDARCRELGLEAAARRDEGEWVAGAWRWRSG